MQTFEMNYYEYLWYNFAPNILMLLFVFLAYGLWRISIKNDEIRIERERLIFEKERQKESMQQALQKYERESNRFNETERKLQEIINRIDRENKELSARTKKYLNEIEEKTQKLHKRNQYEMQSQYYRPEPRSSKNDDDKTFEMICEGIKVVGAVAMMFFAGKAALK